MKDRLAACREYPHLVVQTPRRNWRRPIAASNEPTGPTPALEDDTFVAPGMVDAAGALTERGRQIVLRRLVARAKVSRGRTCVVWSARSCTWIDGDGRTIDGTRPPHGELTNPWAAPRQQLRLEDCRAFRLPEGCDATHLCVRRVAPGIVEVSPGEPIVLVDFDEPAVEGLADPAEGMLDAAGRLRPPTTLRGVRVSGVDGWRVLGPVQPLDGGRILRNPWPDDVRAACLEVAGRDLPIRLTDAAWHAIDPQDPELDLVDVLDAA